MWMIFKSILAFIIITFIVGILTLIRWCFEFEEDFKNKERYTDDEDDCQCFDKKIGM